MSDPATAITDYMLAVECFVFAVLLFQNSEQRWAVFLWGAAFIALGLSASTGGVFHHLRLDLSPQAGRFLWQATSVMLVTAIAFFFSSGVCVSTRGSLRVLLFVLIAALFVAAVFWSRRSGGEVPGGRVVQILLGIVVVLVAMLVRHWGIGGSRMGTDMLIGSIICLIGVTVQQAAIALHPRFNHNDLCHVMFMIGLYFLYRGGMLFRDKL
jgi:hypothetical protein